MPENCNSLPVFAPFLAGVNIVMPHFLAGVNIVMRHFLGGVRIVMRRFWPASTSAPLFGRRPHYNALLFGWRHHLLKQCKCSDLLIFSCPEGLFTYEVSQKWGGLESKLWTPDSGPPLVSPNQPQIKIYLKFMKQKVNFKEENIHIRITYTIVK